MPMSCYIWNRIRKAAMCGRSAVMVLELMVACLRHTAWRSWLHFSSTHLLLRTAHLLTSSCLCPTCSVVQGDLLENVNEITMFQPSQPALLRLMVGTSECAVTCAFSANSIVHFQTQMGGASDGRWSRRARDTLPVSDSQGWCAESSHTRRLRLCLWTKNPFGWF